MKGSYTLKINWKKLQYVLTIKRNLTIIKGDGATGKTTLCNLIYNSVNNKIPSIKIQVYQKDSLVNRQLYVLNNDNWKTLLNEIKNSFILIDEENDFVYSNEFATAIKFSSNYFIIFTRHNKRLDQLSYSVDSLNILVEQAHIIRNKPYLSGSKCLIKDNSKNNLFNFVKFITEDSTSGYRFFKNILGEKCITCKGKDNLLNLLTTDLRYDNEIIVINVDGCAFGAPLEKLITLNKIKSNYIIYLYDSFEWLLLNSINFKSNKIIQSIIDYPEDNIDIEKYDTYENFYYQVLKCICSNLNFTYAKTSNGVPKFLLTNRNYQWLFSKFYKEVGLYRFIDVDISTSFFS